MEKRMEEAVKAYNDYRKMAKADLKVLVKRSYRVVDTNTDKETLIMMLIESNFGRRIAEGLSNNL